ncbi:hypothetical protein, conserved [Eimeria brunetti]|uniref:Uncharacterized protein n=1 Tax=Eimeria brunetti TaxID=51314 RepID=U6LZW2_9EIME|nr:hypothetical protein, conserved [Eimeria brunetti]
MRNASPETFDGSESESRYSASGSPKGHSKGSKKEQYPFVKMPAEMQLPDGADTGSDLQRFRSPEQASHNGKLNGWTMFNSRVCSKIGSLCGKSEEILCGFPIDSPFNDCVVLGHDVAAKKSGGSINYQQTSGAVSHGALVVSQLLQKVASFAMPELGFGVSSTSLSLNTASKMAATKLLQSYYPLYNHNNDPGVLVTDSNATYIIQEGKERSACQTPVTRSDPVPWGHVGDEDWCQIPLPGGLEVPHHGSLTALQHAGVGKAGTHNE